MLHKKLLFLLLFVSVVGLSATDDSAPSRSAEDSSVPSGSVASEKLFVFPWLSDQSFSESEMRGWGLPEICAKLKIREAFSLYLNEKRLELADLIMLHDTDDNDGWHAEMCRFIDTFIHEPHYNLPAQVLGAFIFFFEAFCTDTPMDEITEDKEKSIRELMTQVCQGCRKGIEEICAGPQGNTILRTPCCDAVICYKCWIEKKKIFVDSKLSELLACKMSLEEKEIELERIRTDATIIQPFCSNCSSGVLTDSSLQQQVEMYNGKVCEHAAKQSRK